jgi:RecA-family ATPase
MSHAQRKAFRLAETVWPDDEEPKNAPSNGHSDGSDDDPFLNGLDEVDPGGPPVNEAPPIGEPVAPERKIVLRVYNPADWEGQPVPRREWVVPDYIPADTVTMLGGNGATGKSLLALQLGVGMALAKEWIGLLPEPGRSLILSAEDDFKEMHRRVEDIRKFYGARMADLGDMRLVDLVGEDSVLGALMKGQIQPAPMYYALDAYMADFKPRMTALDVLSDMFAGDENSRPQARQFIGLLKRLAQKHHCAILLLSHPSLTGLNTGTGTSGSTGWNNAVRSRLYFQTAKASDGSEPIKTMRTLEGLKSNYGAPGGKIDLEWKNGLFVPVQGPGGFDKLANEQKAEEAYLKTLKSRIAQSRTVSDKLGANYAPAIFAREPEAIAAGITAKLLGAAMERLFKAGKIRVEIIGPPSRQTRSIVIVEENSASEDV